MLSSSAENWNVLSHLAAADSGSFFQCLTTSGSELQNYSYFQLWHLSWQGPEPWSCQQRPWWKKPPVGSLSSLGESWKFDFFLVCGMNIFKGLKLLQISPGIWILNLQVERLHSLHTHTQESRALCKIQNHRSKDVYVCIYKICDCLLQKSK